jgi:hypothetical protein
MEEIAIKIVVLFKVSLAYKAASLSVTARSFRRGLNSSGGGADLI